MLEEIRTIISTLPAGLIYISLSIIILSLAKILKNFLSPYDVNVELTAKDNPALGISITGYYLAVLIILIGVIYHPEDTEYHNKYELTILLKDLALTLGYSTLGIILLNLAHFLVDKMVLTKFSTRKEIIEDRNSGTGAVEFGSYIASGLIIAGAVNGETGSNWYFGIVTTLVFFTLGQLILIIFARFYQVITGYDIHDEIEKDNVSAGIALGGNLIAMGIIILNSVAGDFLSWQKSMVDLFTWSIIGFIVIMIFRFLIDMFFIPDSTITEEIKRDKNVNAAFIESAILIGISSIIFFIL